MLDAHSSIASFINALAERTPTPGGGATASLAAALAVAQAQMVVRFSVGRKASTPESDATLSLVLNTLTHAQAILLGLMAEDQEAYEAYRATRSPESVARCLLIPQSVLASVVASAAAMARVSALLNPNLQADRIVTARLLIAAAHGAAALVAANLEGSAAHLEIASQTSLQVRRVESILQPLL